MENYILSDEELRELSEMAPCTEGGTLQDFLDEVMVAAAAVKEAGAELQSEKARTLFLMRSVYFLGVQRGGEAYRWMMRESVSPDTPEHDPIEFQPSEACSELLALDLDCLCKKDLNKLWKELGIKKD